MAKKPAKPRQLKVFRTAIGFHDAYVATPTKKAALAAWGAKKDLFAQGAAELVTDAALSAAPLAAPGTVIKVSRGTTAEQIAALPNHKPARAGKVDPKPQKAGPAVPKPSRGALDRIEAAIAAAEAKHAARLRDLADREAALAKERRALTADQSRIIADLEKTRDAERAAYDAALGAWRG